LNRLGIVKTNGADLPINSRTGKGGAIYEGIVSPSKTAEARSIDLPSFPMRMNSQTGVRGGVNWG